MPSKFFHYFKARQKTKGKLQMLKWTICNSNMTQFPKNYMKFVKKTTVFWCFGWWGPKSYDEATVVMWLPSGSTRVASENSSHSYQLSHHSWHSKQLRWIESHSWWESWYECDAFSRATRVEPGGNHITTVASYVAFRRRLMMHSIVRFFLI